MTKDNKNYKVKPWTDGKYYGYKVTFREGWFKRFINWIKRVTK